MILSHSWSASLSSYINMLNPVFKCFSFLDPQILVDMGLERIYEKYSSFFRESVQLFMCLCFMVLKKINKNKQGIGFGYSVYYVRNK